MKMKTIPTFLALLGIAAAPAALAQDCCGGKTAADVSGCPMNGMKMSGESEGACPAMAVDSAKDSSSRHVFMQPVQSVFDNYMKIETALAQDSLKGISSSAAAIAKDVRGDSMKMLGPKVAEQSDALAQAKTLKDARSAFKGLSESLLRYIKDHKVPAGSYYEAYCPMAKASWIQTDKTIVNPYMGKEMLHCGIIRS